MKKSILLLLVALVCSLSMSAQSAADKIVGTYQASQDGKTSKVKIFKYNGGYRCQVYWIAEPKNADGSIKKDTKNPDQAKRNTPMSQVVIVDKVVYKDGIWKDGKIYDPTSGKTYNVEFRIKDAKTLEVRGKLGPFYKKLYWPRLS